MAHVPSTATDPDRAADSPAPTDSAAHVEKRGIELIGDDARHGRARDLFGVWAAPSVSVLSLTVGASLILSGLGLTQALLVILAGALPWVLPGIIAVAGPAAGTSGSVITRAMFGFRGNKFVQAIMGWLFASVYLALTWLAAAFLGSGLLAQFGFADPVIVPIAVTLVVASITVLVAVYGHGLILRAYPYLAIVLAVIFAVVIGFILPKVDWGYAPAEPLTGVPLWSAITISFAVLASTPMSFMNSPDLSRYLPRTTKPAHIITATALGGALPQVLITFAGALLATAVGAGIDAGLETALLGMLPSWLGVLFVLGVLTNAVALNGMTTYSASMTLQAIGVPIRRIPAAIVVGILGTALTTYLVLSSSLLEAVNLVLQFMILVSAPIMAIFVADVVMRRGHYVGDELFDGQPGGRFWYTAGWGIPGVTAFVVAGVASSLTVSTTIWTGPISRSMGSIDLSVPVALVVAAAVYVGWLRISPAKGRP